MINKNLKILNLNILEIPKKSLIKNKNVRIKI